MLHDLNIWILGGDKRQVILGQLLSEDGHTVHFYGVEQYPHIPNDCKLESTLDGIGKADCVFLPLPVSKDSETLFAPLSSLSISLVSLFQQLSPSQLLFGARATAPVIQYLTQYQLNLLDYSTREEFSIANAIPTAEGAIQLMMEQLPITIHHSNILILGFGRIGRILADRLSALGAKVTVAARRYDSLTWATVWGYDTEMSTHLSRWLCRYDCVVNTIPAPILTHQELEGMKEGCLVVDLASLPGGVDHSAASKLGIHTIHALSLPGKVAPTTAGKIVRDTVYHMLEELELSRKEELV